MTATYSFYQGIQNHNLDSKRFLWISWCNVLFKCGPTYIRLLRDLSNHVLICAKNGYSLISLDSLMSRLALHFTVRTVL